LQRPFRHQGTSAPVANRRLVRNRALHDHLLAFAQPASERLTAALDEGAEIPFEVAENPGADSVLYHYRPLSDHFVREQLAELRGVEGFGAALLALAKVEGLSGYLRAIGVSYVPAAERDRAETALREFLARVWQEVTGFEFDEGRFERAYRELESVVYEDTVVNTVLASLPGVRLTGGSWDLGSGITLSRGDECEAPPEAVWEGAVEREPNTLVLLTVESAPRDDPPLTMARLEFRKLLTTLRLFKSGAAALGSTAWWRVDDGPWQTAPLGQPGHHRFGDYWLEAGEREDLIDLFEVVSSRPMRGGPLPWSLSRFEMGCERPLSIEGLTDHLLVLRALLDGDEPSPVGMSLRLAALCGEPSERRRLQARVEQAFKLQRLVMRGDLEADYVEAIGSDSPDKIAREVEEHLRAILRDMICGYLEADVKRIADDLLLTDDPPPPAPPEPEDKELKVSRTPKAEEKPRARRKSQPAKSSRARPKIAEEKRKTKEATKEAEEEGEEPTQEFVAVGAVGALAEAGDGLDWGFGDDPSDYSAAV
jgi:hypothetical protein